MPRHIPITCYYFLSTGLSSEIHLCALIEMHKNEFLMKYNKITTLEKVIYYLNSLDAFVHISVKVDHNQLFLSSQHNSSGACGYLQGVC